MPTVKQASTRFSIVQRSKGQSAIEKASYISRSEIKSEFDGKTYRPKYHEDLVHSEISLPPHAPKEFQDRATLWNSVEAIEKGQKSQLARMVKVSLPNDWSYNLATDVLRDYIQKNFVDKGMCADWAIHDSENPKGERNLHAHIMLTLRPLEQDGSWGTKQKKVYILDKDGNKIKNKNGKGWKCTTQQTTDWNSKDNAKMWRANLVKTINAVNEKIGLDEKWEHRTYEEQGVPLIPTIHLGAKASYLERKGVATERGNINRAIMIQNAIIREARAMETEARKVLIELVRQGKKLDEAKNEITEMIDTVEARKQRLDLPIVSGHYLAMVSNRSDFQKPSIIKSFLSRHNLKSFKEVKLFAKNGESRYVTLNYERIERAKKIDGLSEISKKHIEYLEYKKFYDKSQELSGFAKFRFDRANKDKLEKYHEVRAELVELANGEKLAPKRWAREIDEFTKENVQTEKELALLTTELAITEVIDWNRKNLERELENEKRQREKQLSNHKNKNQSL